MQNDLGTAKSGCVNTARSGESAYHEFAGVNDSVSLEFMDGLFLHALKKL